MATAQVGTNYPITIPDGDEEVRQGDDAMLKMATDITHGLDTLLGLSSTGGTAVTDLKAFITKSLGNPTATAIGGTVGAAMKVIAQSAADNKTALDGLTAAGGEITLAHTAAEAAKRAAADADTKASQAAANAAAAHRDLATLNATGGKLYELDKTVGGITAANTGSLAMIRKSVADITKSGGPIDVQKKRIDIQTNKIDLMLSPDAAKNPLVQPGTNAVRNVIDYISATHTNLITDRTRVHVLRLNNVSCAAYGTAVVNQAVSAAYRSGDVVANATVHSVTVHDMLLISVGVNATGTIITTVFKNVGAKPRTFNAAVVYQLSRH